MKTIKYLILIVGILAFSTGAYSVIIEELSIQWIGFIGGGFLIWLFFNIDKFIKKETE
jgi:hypothetical protein